MKVDLKIVFVSVVVLSLVNETAGRIGRGGFGSRSRTGSSSGRVRLGSRIGSSPRRVRLGSRIGSLPGRVRLGSRIGSLPGRVRLGSRIGSLPGRVRLGSRIGSLPGRVRLGSRIGSLPVRVRLGSRIGSLPGRVRLGSRIGSSPGKVRLGSRIGSRIGSWFGRARPGSRIGSKSGSLSGRKIVSFPHDIKTKTGLTKLYNTKVSKVKHVQRPLFGGWLGKVAAKYTPLKHTGVVVTTNKGNNWLVHKGGNYGKSSQTVVVDAKHMSNKWKGIGSKKVSGVHIKDYVKAGGKKYRFLSNNCQHASCRMFQLKG